MLLCFYAMLYASMLIDRLVGIPIIWYAVGDPHTAKIACLLAVVLEARRGGGRRGGSREVRAVDEGDRGRFDGRS